MARRACQTTKEGLESAVQGRLGRWLARRAGQDPLAGLLADLLPGPYVRAVVRRLP
jgi:hypothetical protein